MKSSTIAVASLVALASAVPLQERQAEDISLPDIGFSTFSGTTAISTGFTATIAVPTDVAKRQDGSPPSVPDISISTAFAATVTIPADVKRQDGPLPTVPVVSFSDVSLSTAFGATVTPPADVGKRQVFDGEPSASARPQSCVQKRQTVEIGSPNPGEVDGIPCGQGQPATVSVSGPL